ncbi:MAG: hypothetical protein HYU39_01120 [Thaumarchaeota archaeon]|nr:hypothetical protein [Nitrososphaerota archaeon]
MGKVKAITVVIVSLITVVVVAEAGLLLTGLQHVSVGQAQVSGTTAIIPLTVPNRGFLDLSGKMNISILDRGGSVLQTTENSFRIPAGRTETINLAATMPRSGSPAKVRVETTITVGGILSIPLPAVESPLPAL